MSEKRTILKGTFILTATGILSRFIGFFYRMFLSHTFGEESVGLYHLIFPVYALCFSFTAAGMETAISRCIANRISLGKKEEAERLLYTGLFLSLFLSLFTMYFLQRNAAALAVHVLGDVRCERLLVIISYALPFSAVHSCICGYYFGLKQTGIPAASQLIEQLIRVLSVYVIYLTALKKNWDISIAFAVTGLVFGEIISSSFCLKCFSGRKTAAPFRLSPGNSFRCTGELLRLSAPLTLNRILLNILQSIEAVSIPLKLQQYGCTQSEALSTYGVLTGMALPCIFFPSAVTNSVATMLLPTVAEIQASDKLDSLQKLIRNVIFYCFFLGFLCCLIFLISGYWAGKILFRSELAGKFILTLAWICPFLYMNSTLISIINGLGKTTATFLTNTLGLIIRITGVIVFIPRIGMNGYLRGLLLSQLTVSVLCILNLNFFIKKNRESAD